MVGMSAVPTREEPCIKWLVTTPPKVGYSSPWVASMSQQRTS